MNQSQSQVVQLDTTASQQNRSKIASIELMRVIAMFAVVVIHVRLFIAIPMNTQEPWLADLANQLSRFAVPFFFLVAGYFIAPKLISSSGSSLREMRRYNAPLLKLWLVWTAICLVLPIRFDILMQEGYVAERTLAWLSLAETPLNTLLEGSLVHLWFLPSLMLAIAIIALLQHARLGQWMLPLATVLYLYGVLAGSYSEITGWEAPFFTRNGPFFSLLLVSIGVAIRQNAWSVTRCTAWGLMLLGLFGHMAEASWLYHHGIAFAGHDFLFSTALWATGLFLLLLLHPNWGDHPLTFYLSQWTLPIYVCHLSIAIVLYNLVAMFQIEAWYREGVMFFGTYFGALLLVIMLSRTKLKPILFR